MTRVDKNLQTQKVIPLTKNAFKLNSFATVNRKAGAGGGRCMQLPTKGKRKKEAVQDKNSFTRPSSLRTIDVENNYALNFVVSYPLLTFTLLMSETEKYSMRKYRCADKSLARATSQCILYDDQNISFDASLVIYINSTNILPIMIIKRIYETLKSSVAAVCFLPVRATDLSAPLYHGSLQP